MVFVKHDDETRRRAVELIILGWPMERVTGALSVSERSVLRWEARYTANHGPFKLDYSLCGRRSKLRAILDDIDALVEEEPTLYLDEYVDWAALTRNVLVAKSTMCDALLKLGHTVKKLRKTAAQRDEMERAAWHGDIHRMYRMDQIVTVDESGISNGNLERTRGRSRRGQRAVVSTPYDPLGDRRSLLAALTADAGYIATRFVRDTTDGDVFYDFIVAEVLPQMNAYPANRSVLILDNASVHKTEELREAVEAQGCVICFLPPFSPDFNPIEESFSAVKAYLRRYGFRMHRGIDLEEDLLMACGAAVTADKAAGWFHDSGCYRI